VPCSLAPLGNVGGDVPPNPLDFPRLQAGDRAASRRCIRQHR
jgi:hypothetical protein